MKQIILAIVFCMVTAFAYADIQLTQEQFENMDILHSELKKVDVNFIGIAGSKDNMKVYGMGEEQAETVINALDLDTLIAEKEIADQEAEDAKEEEKLLRLLDREDIKTKIKNL